MGVQFSQDPECIRRNIERLSAKHSRGFDTTPLPKGTLDMFDGIGYKCLFCGHVVHPRLLPQDAVMVAFLMQALQGDDQGGLCFRLARFYDQEPVYGRKTVLFETLSRLLDIVGREITAIEAEQVATLCFVGVPLDGLLAAAELSNEEVSKLNALWIYDVVFSTNYEPHVRAEIVEAQHGFMLDGGDTVPDIVRNVEMTFREERMAGSTAFNLFERPLN